MWNQQRYSLRPDKARGTETASNGITFATVQSLRSSVNQVLPGTTLLKTRLHLAACIVYVHMSSGMRCRLRDESRLSSKWIAGDMNISRDTDLPDAVLTTLYVFLASPHNFKIEVLAAEISSWLTSLLQQLLAQVVTESTDSKSTTAWFRVESYICQIDIKSRLPPISLLRRPLGRSRKFLFHPSKKAISAWQTKERNGTR
jgi:hypothetical protein